jgi:hypothetical protein
MRPYSLFPVLYCEILRGTQRATREAAADPVAYPIKSPRRFEPSPQFWQVRTTPCHPTREDCMSFGRV